MSVYVSIQPNILKCFLGLLQRSILSYNFAVRR
nr:MAG TPA: hypothetical protein [Caudoviricetes sp.]